MVFPFVDRALDDVRLTHQMATRTRIEVSTLINEVSGAGRLAADTAGVRFTVGIGLAFSRWGAEANGGRLYAKNMGNGCVFTVDLPRVAATVLATA